MYATIKTEREKSLKRGRVEAKAHTGNGGAGRLIDRDSEREVWSNGLRN